LPDLAPQLGQAGRAAAGSGDVGGGGVYFELEGFDEDVAVVVVGGFLGAEADVEEGEVGEVFGAGGGAGGAGGGGDLGGDFFGVPVGVVEDGVEGVEGGGGAGVAGGGGGVGGVGFEEDGGAAGVGAGVGDGVGAFGEADGEGEGAGGGAFGGEDVVWGAEVEGKEVGDEGAVEFGADVMIRGHIGGGCQRVGFVDGGGIGEMGNVDVIGIGSDERARALAAYRACATEAERAELYWATPILQEIFSAVTHPAPAGGGTRASHPATPPAQQITVQKNKG